MYCPECGAESTLGLNYCKQCGANLSAKAADPHKSPVGVAMLWAVAVTTVGGLATLMGSLIALVALGIREEGVIVPVTFLGVALVLAVVVMLIRQISRLGVPSSASGLKAKPRTNPLLRREPPQIPVVQAAIPSVTEHTTRHIEEAHLRQSGDREVES